MVTNECACFGFIKETELGADERHGHVRFISVLALDENPQWTEMSGLHFAYAGHCCETLTDDEHIHKITAHIRCFIEENEKSVIVT